MPLSLGAERPTVQDPMIGYVAEFACGYLSSDEALTLRRMRVSTICKWRVSCRQRLHRARS